MYEKFEALLTKENKKPSDVSTATGIPASTFTDWKKGKSCPKTDKLLKIAEFFNVSIEYFLEGSD
ncbi:MAG: helix-turn-helix transcriptional regulator [Candidatus Cloacimonetes bacterium]|nr:helix-turn-helix transcriptional regulator [Candidatus Cloacimonadota bacterium]